MSTETKAALDAAIQAHAADEWGGDYVVDWVLVAGLVDTTDGHSLGVGESRSPMPAYITTGLLTEALNLDTGYERTDDD